MSTEVPEQPLSIVHGDPLAEALAGRSQTIADFAREIAERWPEREALVAHGNAGVVRWSYAELWQHSMAIARALAAHGVSKDSRVGILMTNRPEFIASVFGIALAGGVSVALQTFATEAELEYLLQASGVEVLLLEPRVAKKDFPAMLADLEPAIAQDRSGDLVSERFPFLRHLIALEDEETTPTAGVAGWQSFLDLGHAIPQQVIETRAASLAPSDTALLFFSSGSTGKPKGILHNQRAVTIQWYGWPIAMNFTGPLRAWTANGFFWSGNFAMVIGSALSTGGALVLQSTFDPAEALRLMEDERVNTPFAMLHQWGKMAEQPQFAAADLSSLQFVDVNFIGVQHPTLTTDFRQPQAFGCTETLTINTTCYFGDNDKTRYEGYGLPLPGNTLKIVDPLTGEVLPRGERGEIAVKGPTLMMGYLGKTLEECFDDEGFYHSGDGGYFDTSGWLFWEGRLTDIIKSGGANVSPVEIDDTIATHPGVQANQTVGLPHATLGEIVVSCVVPIDPASFDVADLREFLQARLASYKLPKEILIVAEDELSLTGSGAKIRSADVKKLAAEKLGISQ